MELLSLLPPDRLRELHEAGVALIGPALPPDRGRAQRLGIKPGNYDAVIQQGVAVDVIELTADPPRVINGSFGVPKEAAARVILNVVSANRACFPSCIIRTYRRSRSWGYWACLRARGFSPRCLT